MRASWRRWRVARTRSLTSRRSLGSSRPASRRSISIRSVRIRPASSISTGASWRPACASHEHGVGTRRAPVPPSFECEAVSMFPRSGYRDDVSAPLRSGSVGELRRAAARCTACDLYVRASQTVFGEGPEDAPIVLVGEQPGDHEDREGHPFVGPAGALLDRALDTAGIARSDVYLTNAVKHFKWE